MASKQTYKIRGVRFVQTELNYEEDGKVLDLIRGKLTAFSANQEVLGDLIDRLYQDHVLGKLFQLVLKPYQPTIFHALRNSFFAWKNKIDMTDPIRKMGNSEIARVTRDFFVLNMRWIESFSSLGNGSGLILTASPLTAIPQYLRRLFSTSAAAISNVPKN